ncbi:hypothetical protein EXQ37_18265 [Clostridium botulinum]|nr:hypothetical protein [Clostridium botulinum]MBO0561540.1 hypothetical protein [Clostridium botulinum]
MLDYKKYNHWTIGKCPICGKDIICCIVDDIEDIPKDCYNYEEKYYDYFSMCANHECIYSKGILVDDQLSDALGEVEIQYRYEYETDKEYVHKFGQLIKLRAYNYINLESTIDTILNKFKEDKKKDSKLIEYNLHVYDVKE